MAKRRPHNFYKFPFKRIKVSDQSKKLAEILQMIKNYALTENVQFKTSRTKDQISTEKIQNQKFPKTPEKNQQSKIFTNLNDISSRKKNEQSIMLSKKEKQRSMPHFMLLFLSYLKESAIKAKKDFKRSKGLRQDQVFSGAKTYKCPYCDQVFTRPCSLGGHTSKLHKNLIKNDQEKKKNEESKNKA